MIKSTEDVENFERDVRKAISTAMSRGWTEPEVKENLYRVLREVDEERTRKVEG